MRWTLKPIPETEKINAFAKQLSIPEKIAQLLIQRGIDTYDKAKAFFRPSLDDLHDPFLMKDMDKAVARLNLAIAQNENILVYGDYDVDGTTSVALMSSYLQTLHPQVATYIPDRYAEGYGVSYTGIDYAHDNDITLIVALDCGQIACLPAEFTASLTVDERWGPSIRHAMVQLRGECPDCIDSPPEPGFPD